MQAIFNELSTLQLDKLEESEALVILKNFIQVCKHFQSLDSTFKLRVNPYFWETPLTVGVIREYLVGSEELKDELYFLYAIIDSPYLPNEEIDIDNGKFLDEALVWLNNEQKVAVDGDSGIRVAYAFYPKPAPMISFNTKDWEKIAFINVRPQSKSPIKLINISNHNQIFEVHFEMLIDDFFALKKGNPTTVKISDILPNSIITNTYLEYFEFYTDRNDGKGRVLNSSSTTHTAKIGTTIAKLNGWIKHEKYSKINSRVVFNHTHKDSIFISIDTEKGDFEIHNSDKNSNHLGAISFDGIKIEPPKGHKLKFE